MNTTTKPIRPRARCAPTTLALLLCGALCLPAVPAAGLSAAVPAAPEVPSSQEAARRTERATELMQQERFEDALQELDAAIEADEEYWEAHYQRGRTLGLLGRMAEAYEALLRAQTFNPGMSHIYELASIAAWGADNHDAAWEQIVRAHHAGGDVQRRVQRMVNESPMPDDLMTRLSAPRVFVGEIDIRDVEAQAELPFNRNPLARDDPSRAGVPVEIRGTELANETRPEMAAFVRRFRTAFADSRDFGVVLDPVQSEYELRIELLRVAYEQPRTMEAQLQLVARASGTVGFSRTVTFADISAGGVTRGEIQLLVNEMGGWLRSIRDRQQDPR